MLQNKTQKGERKNGRNLLYIARQILQNEVDITFPYATNDPLTFPICDSNCTILAFPQNMKSFCHALVSIYMYNMLFITKPVLKHPQRCNSKLNENLLSNCKVFLQLDLSPKKNMKKRKEEQFGLTYRNSDKGLSAMLSNQSKPLD